LSQSQLLRRRLWMDVAREAEKSALELRIERLLKPKVGDPIREAIKEELLDTSWTGVTLDSVVGLASENMRQSFALRGIQKYFED
jgi:hypothetical protein